MGGHLVKGTPGVVGVVGEGLDVLHLRGGLSVRLLRVLMFYACAFVATWEAGGVAQQGGPASDGGFVVFPWRPAWPWRLRARVVPVPIASP